MEPINIGFIGGGPRANSLWQTIISIQEYEDLIYPYAVFDKDPKVLKEWAYKVDHTFDSFEDFIGSDIKAALIATPPSTHAMFAKRLLDAGISVWSEVPMALTMDEIYAILDAEKNNRGNFGKYSLGENYCYYLIPQFIARENKNDKFGEIYYAEGEYDHSVEHYMIFENYLSHKIEKEIDPQLAEKVTPTWRATFIPIKYGHALGPALYFINSNSKGRIEHPVEVVCMGNMKMLKRFNTPNFQMAFVKTDAETIIKFGSGFVLGHPGRIFHSAWGTAGIFYQKSFDQPNHYYYSVPEGERYYPARQMQKGMLLTDEDLIKMGTPHATGGHGGADYLMFKSWIDSLVNNKPFELNSIRAAEITAPGIIAAEAEQSGKYMEIPLFYK